MILGETLDNCRCNVKLLCWRWNGCNDLFLSSAGDVSNVVQGADLWLNLELQLLILDLDVSTTWTAKHGQYGGGLEPVLHIGLWHWITRAAPVPYELGHPFNNNNNTSGSHIIQYVAFTLADMFLPKTQGAVLSSRHVGVFLSFDITGGWKTTLKKMQGCYSQISNKNVLFS